MKKLSIILVVLIVAAGCGEENRVNQELEVVNDVVELQVYSGRIILNSPWSIEYKKKSNDGILYFDDEKVISFKTSMPIVEEWDDTSTVILSDTINDQYLEWKIEDDWQYIILKDTEKSGYSNDCYYYSFMGSIPPTFNEKEVLNEFYSKLKELVLANDVKNKK